MKSMEFEWDADFEQKLTMLLLEYRTGAKKPSSVLSQLDFERGARC